MCVFLHVHFAMTKTSISAVSNGDSVSLTATSHGEAMMRSPNGLFRLSTYIETVKTGPAHNQSKGRWALHPDHDILNRT